MHKVRAPQSVQELMHEIRKFAPEGPETAACMDKSMRIVDAYIKVRVHDFYRPTADSVCSQLAMRMWRQEHASVSQGTYAKAY